MIVFSQPYEIDHVEILGNYGSQPACLQEKERALTFQVPRKSSFGCVLLKKNNETYTSL